PRRVIVCRKREAKHRETRDGDSDFEACYSNKKKRIDTPNKEGTFEAMDFASSRKRKQESIFTSTGCANMFKEDIIHRRAKELGNTKLNKKLYQLNKLGVGSKLLERMRWEGGGLGKCGQGIFLSIEVNTRPNNLLTCDMIASQQHFEENEEEDEAMGPTDKADHTDVMSVWKDLLQGNEIDSPYAQLFMEVVLCAVMRSSINTWQAKHPEPLLQFLYSWERLLPHPALQRILGQIVVPKLLAAVNSWDPHTDSIPMHIWVHPWLPLLGQKHSILYDTVRTKLESVLNAWHPSDVSAYTILSPWKPVFDREIWEQIMVRCISPKLLAVMHEFQVSPADQKLDQYYWVRKWANVIPIHHMLYIMIVFLNKWLEALIRWLRSQPIIQEVSNWYLRWQYLIPFEILSNEHIRGLLNMGLDMMNQAVGHK
nr:septin and tuftelin-interacting protein 1 homolog 1 [Tanacetum cinerariifolium]